MKRTLNRASMLGLLLMSAPALAQNPNWIDTTRGGGPATMNPLTTISGSDTLNKVMDSVIASLAGAGQLSGGIVTYQGCGSSCGERIMVGSPSTADVTTCIPTDANGGTEGNPGCQEIAPMSRQMNTSICDDDPNIEGSLTTNNQAENMAICADGLVIVGNNDSIGAYGEDATACTNYFASTTTDNTGNSFPDRHVGNLRRNGPLPLTPSYTILDWKDVLRLVYTGCKNTDGTCAGTTAAPKTVADRVNRCNGAERTELINNWGSLFTGVACAGSTGCPTGLRHAYRRDDSSGTTGVFIELLGVAFDPVVNLTSRATFVDGLPPVVTPLTANQSYCDGGHNEGVLITHVDAASAPKWDNGDPIRKNCAAEDDICGPDGKLGVVRAVRSTDVAPLNAYPTHQCSKKFAYKTWLSTVLPVCPDRTKPSASRCKFPYFESGTTVTFNCLASRTNADAKAAAGTDGRSYNYVIHATDGTVQWQDAAKKMPWVASWRQNMANLNADTFFTAGKEFVAADYQCIENDATRNIGCLTAKSKCTLGFSGREAAYNTGTSDHLANEPARLNLRSPSNPEIIGGLYPLGRLLWVNASRGFENIMLDCVDRGGTAAYCNDQVRIASEFYNAGAVGNFVNPACSAAGFIPLDDGVQCVGGASPGASAGCGANPAAPVKADCLPDARTYASLANRCNVAADCKAPLVCNVATHVCE